MPKNNITGTNVAYATSVGQLQGKLNNLNSQINSLKKNLAQKRNEKATLENQIAIFNSQIQQLNLKIQATETEITKTQLEITETTQKIARTKKELEKQKDLLRENLRVLYEQGGISLVEVLASSDDLSTFLDRSEYLQTIQRKIQESKRKIEKLKKELDDKKKSLETKKSDLENMKKELNGQKTDLAAQKAQKNALLASTKNQEVAFQAQLANAQSAFASVQSQINSILSAPSPSAPSPVIRRHSSFGSVKRGQIIGHQGNSGYSFGSHLHFGVYRGTRDIDPMPYLNNGTFSWPLVNPTITQGYWGKFSHRGVGWPGGVDMSKYYGAPVRAAADGNIIFNGYNAKTFGHYIIMDHGNGLRTLYGHMQ